MLWFYHPGYNYGRWLPRPRQIHGFVPDKPARIRAHLRAQGVARDFIAPAPVSAATLHAVHARSVVSALGDPRAIARAVELPLLARLPRPLLRHVVVAPQLRAAGGTCQALRAAAQGYWAANLSGGFHHARPEQIHGFCLVNDVAAAVHELACQGLRPPIAVIDLDLHQGDGNAAAFADCAHVLTASLHQESAFPIPKLAGDIDIGLPAGVADEAYLARTDELLQRVAAAVDPALIIYIAGTDPFHRDAIGDLRVSRAGLVERDRRVARFAKRVGAALVLLPAGGYSLESPEIAASGFAAVAAVEAEV